MFSYQYFLKKYSGLTKVELLKMIEAIYQKKYSDDTILDIQLEALEEAMPAHIRAGIFEEELKHFENAIQKVFDTLVTLISESKTKAASTNKPLMILLGENHSSMRSLVLEGIILYICKNYFNINTVMSENSFEFDLNPTESLSRRRAWSEHIGIWSIDIPITLFLNELNIAPKRLDIKTRLTRNYDSSISIEGLRDRNSEMLHIAMEDPNDCVGIVGAWHLHGMLEETSLQETFSVLPINLCERPSLQETFSVLPINHWQPPKSRSAAHDALTDYYLSAEKCFQAIDMIADLTQCFTPQMALNVVREICQEKIDERLGYSITPVARLSNSKRNAITPAYNASCSASEASTPKRQCLIQEDTNNEKHRFCVIL